MTKILRALFIAAVCVAFPLAAHADGPILNMNPERTIHLPSDPEAAIRHAREQVAGGELNGAIRELARYVAAHPDEAGPARLLGDLYYRAGDLHKAEVTYLDVIRQYPRDKETHNRLGSVYATENRVDDAIDEFNRSLPGTDSVPDLVRLHQRRGDFAQYERLKERVANDYPTDPEAQLELAKVYYTTHRNTEALLYYKRALDNSPQNIIAFNGIALAYMDLHDYDPAIEALQQCLRVDRQEYSCEDNLAAAHLEMGQLSQAEKELTYAHDLQPERSEAIVNFGYLADARGDWKRAVSYYLEALSVYPYARDAYIDLGFTYEQHKQFTLAQSVLLKGLAIAPDDGRLHFLLGQTYADQGEAALARAQYAAAAACDDPTVRRIAAAREASIGTVHQK